jgi:ABC-type multidrug transport system ATPase subunit
MLEVCQLTKLYGGIAVVDRVSFTIRPGEILGYLGPNGAAKSTTLAGRRKMVLHSSHVLEVVEKICEAVLILRKGQVVAHDSVANLRRLMAESSLLT